MPDDVNPLRAETRDTVIRAAAPVQRAEHGENLLTRMIEHQTAKIPSMFFLIASVGAMALSIALELNGRSRVSRFTGMSAGPLLTMGLYNKMVKMLGAR
jgi:hypothetical protein